MEVSEDQLLTPPITPTDNNNTSNELDSENIADKEITVNTDSEVVDSSASGTESRVDTDSSGIDRTDSQTYDQAPLLKGDKSEMEDLPDLSYKCTENKDTDSVEVVCKNIDSENDRHMECSTTEICGSSDLNLSISGSDNKTADETVATEISRFDRDNNVDSVLELKANISEESEERKSEMTHQDVQSSEHRKGQESEDTVVMEADNEVCQARKTHTCSTSSVCYGDKDTCGCSADINELRKMWKPAIVRCSVSKRLGRKLKMIQDSNFKTVLVYM